MREFFDCAYMCIDYTLELKNALKASQLLQYLAPEDIIGRAAIAPDGCMGKGGESGRLMPNGPHCGYSTLIVPFVWQQLMSYQIFRCFS